MNRKGGRWPKNPDTSELKKKCNKFCCCCRTQSKFIIYYLFWREVYELTAQYGVEMSCVVLGGPRAVANILYDNQPRPRPRPTSSLGDSRPAEKN